MSKTIHEERVKGLLDKDQAPIARGKVNWVTKEEADKLGVVSYIFEGIDVDDVEIREFKDDLINALRKKGFVFFDDTVYRYKTNKRGRIIEFGVNYMKID